MAPKRGPGRPFEIGNPGGGRPKGGMGLMHRIRRLTEDGAELVDIALTVARGSLVIRRTCVTAEGEERTIDEAPGHRDRMDAVKYLSDRGWGKAKESLELSGPDGEGLVFNLNINLSGNGHKS